MKIFQFSRVLQIGLIMFLSPDVMVMVIVIVMVMVIVMVIVMAHLNVPSEFSATQE